MIRIRKIYKTFTTPVLKDISCDMKTGEVIALIGPNGAGKTTLMRLITGILHPTSGNILFNNKNILTDFEYKKHIGYMPENSALYDDMNVYNYLKFISEVRKIPKQEINNNIISIAEQIGISSVIHQKISTLSKGFKRRVALAQAIIHNPDVIILDEPTEGLDPNQKKEFYSLIKSFSKNKLILISTHALEEITQCTRVLLLNHGELILDTDMKKLKIGKEETLSDIFYRLTKGTN